jgi:hypothetical protein
MNDKQIEDLLNPILGESMKASLNLFMEMKEQGQLEKGDTETISFLNLFLEDAFEYYSNIKDTQNLAILSDLKQYLIDITK